MIVAIDIIEVWSTFSLSKCYIYPHKFNTLCTLTSVRSRNAIFLSQVYQVCCENYKPEIWHRYQLGSCESKQKKHCSG